MIDHIWTVVCSNVVTDKDTNNVSLHNVIEQLSIEKIPDEVKEQAQKEGLDKFIIPFKIHVVSLWAREDLNKGSIGYGRINLISPSGDPLTRSQDFEINLLDHRRFRSRGNFPGFPIVGEGKYKFIVELRETETSKWEIVAEIPVEVRIKDK